MTTRKKPPKPKRDPAKEPFASPSDAKRKEAIEEIRYGDPQLEHLEYLLAERDRAAMKAEAARLQQATEGTSAAATFHIFSSPDASYASATGTGTLASLVIDELAMTGAKVTAGRRKGGKNSHKYQPEEIVRLHRALNALLDEAAKPGKRKQTDRALAARFSALHGVPEETARGWIKRIRRAERKNVG